MTRAIAETRNLDSTVALLSAVRGAAVRLRGRVDESGLRLVHDAIGPVDLEEVTAGAEFEVDVSPARKLVAGQVNRGTVGVRAADGERWYAAGDVYLAAQPGQARTIMIRPGQHEQVVIHPDLINQVAQAAPDRAGGPVRFTGYTATSPQAAARWRATFGYVRSTLLAVPESALHPLVAVNVARLLAATALGTFPNDALTEPTAQDRRDGSAATFRRAAAFIDEHASEDVTMAGIAAAASVTIRAVQLAFRRQLGTTPTQYLLQVRLDHAHRELIAADPRGESVTAVAYRWGFTSPGRFAASYRKVYGILPSHSLRGSSRPG
jgi:AraC-like DNA-binding protein